MAYINLALTTKTDRLQVLNDAIGANATIVVYDSLYPASPDKPPAANALASFVCNPAAFGNVAVQATVIANVIANVAALTSLAFAPQLSTANGTATWARISNAAGNAIVDLDVGLANASITINSTDLIAGVPVQLVSVTITEQ
jgi:hypothetical protein